MIGGCCFIFEPHFVKIILAKAGNHFHPQCFNKGTVDKNLQFYDFNPDLNYHFGVLHHMSTESKYSSEDKSKEKKSNRMFVIKMRNFPCFIGIFLVIGHILLLLGGIYHLLGLI